MDLNLKNKTAVVCGSTQGIGKAVALELAAMGANIILVARSKDKLETVLHELNQINKANHSYVCVDFSDPSDLEKKMKELGKNNTVHILINNTGGPPGGLAHEAEIEAFRIAFNMHLVCNHILVNACKESMISTGYGRIINIISTSVKQPLPGLGVSNTIRGAVANWSKTLANELGQYGITVNNVLPGATNTVRLQSIIEQKAKKNGVDYELAANEMKASVPSQRFAEAAEVANAVAFLASPAAAYINGINLPVDGGRTKCL